MDLEVLVASVGGRFRPPLSTCCRKVGGSFDDTYTRTNFGGVCNGVVAKDGEGLAVFDLCGEYYDRRRRLPGGFNCLSIQGELVVINLPISFPQVG